MFQILNRIHSSSSTFQYVQVSSLPFLECVHKFVILVPTIGILLSLLGNEIDEKGNLKICINIGTYVTLKL